MKINTLEYIHELLINARAEAQTDIDLEVAKQRKLQAAGDITAEERLTMDRRRVYLIERRDKAKDALNDFEYEDW